MNLSIDLTQLRQRAVKFAKNFANADYEMGQAQLFIIEFCKIFELDYLRAVSFESRVKMAKGKGRIDAFFPGVLLVEMKSKDKNLEDAYIQATDYLQGLKDDDLPRCILISDFQNLHLYNQETKEPPLKIKLAELPNFIEQFRFLTGYQKIVTERQERINKTAAEKMADLHDAMKLTGYHGKDLETYLVRLLFCLFADSTGLFGENGAFLDYLFHYTEINGLNLHGALSALFDTLNKPNNKRPKNLPEVLTQFPYINGELFEGLLSQCYFDEESRNLLIKCAKFDWSEISPAIFGSLFQAIMHFDDEMGKSKTKKRREFGAHYTSEENILKTINPLFMDELRLEFEKCGKNKTKLSAFHQKLSELNFFDPACGCGNFLIIAYREIRLLELDVIKIQYNQKLISHIDIDTLILCNVNQFHGIDIDESAVHIATLAMWLTDHQMNMRVQELGLYYTRIPLLKKANIVCANALRIDWESIINPKACHFIMGNPPFVGYSYQTKTQKEDLHLVFQNINGTGVLDYVSGWHIKAARYIQANKNIAVAFVSTNSLTQGEQVGILWTELLQLNIRLFFAHRTFQWNNEGRGVAAVHCVIMGFYCVIQKPNKREKCFSPNDYFLFDYPDIKGTPIKLIVSQINPYLVDAPTILIKKRYKPLNVNSPELIFGNMPVDGGHLLLTEQEANFIKQTDQIAANYIRPFLGSAEFINNIPRYCLWLKDSTANDRIHSFEIKKRLELVKQMRLASQKIPTQKRAETPYLFGEIRQTNQPYLLIPRVSSETRQYIPIDYVNANIICGDANFMLPNGTLYDFGLLNSSFHNAWTRAIAGRLKNDYRYSNTIVYNNFPFPNHITVSQKTKIEIAAQAILDARKIEQEKCEKHHQKYSLANIYAANNMPADLIKAHNQLDKAVDAAYDYKGDKEDAARVAFLFELYQKLTAPLVETKPLKPRKKYSAK
ncbi:MAG: putative adenine-specific methylase [Pseudomonadota bacterium]